MQNLPVPTTSPVKVAPETFLIPNLAPAGDAYLPVNSLLIRGKEPIVVDTGAPVHREHWLEQVYSLVEPRDIRWIFISHEDGHHVGGLDTVEGLRPRVITSAHGPILTGDAIHDAFDRVRTLAGQPAIAPPG